MSGSKIKVLHIGNVANYAYNIGKLLQTPRIESHVINWDYYHIASRPQWEEADFSSANIGNHYFPTLPAESETGFAVPSWYIHGPRTLAALYLIAYNERKLLRAYLIRALNNRYLIKISDCRYRMWDSRVGFTRLLEAICLDLVGVGRLNTARLLLSGYRKWKGRRAPVIARAELGAIATTTAPGAEGRTKVATAPRRRQSASAAEQTAELVPAGGKLVAGNLRAEPRTRRAVAKTRTGCVPLESMTSRMAPDPNLTKPQQGSIDDPIYFGCGGEVLTSSSAQLSDRRSSQSAFDTYENFDRLVAKLSDEYRAEFPDRDVKPDLLKQFEPTLPLMERLFKSYDLVIGYAIEGVWPLLANKMYLAYEFGTIRNMPFTDDGPGKLAFLAFRNADQTIVTNPDNNRAAEKLGLNYFFLPHVINEGGIPSEDETKALREYLMARYGGDFFIFHPPRQHWNSTRDTNWDKGNDHFFRGFANFVKTTAPSARCIAVDWGESVRESRRLTRLLGITNNVVWVAPQPHIRMMRYIAASDCVADQFNMPSFGGIPPKAFYLAKPVLCAFEPDMHKWCYDEMPPLPPARTASEISALLMRLYLEPRYAAELGQKGQAWYQKYNSSRRVLDILEGRILELTCHEFAIKWSA